MFCKVSAFASGSLDLLKAWTKSTTSEMCPKIMAGLKDSEDVRHNACK